MYCKYCGKKLDDGVSFCTGCGKPVQKQIRMSEPEKYHKKPKKIFIDERYQIAKNINGYLLDAANVYVESRNKPICNIPEIGIGNKPIDGGYYLFEKEEMEEFIKKEPEAKKYFRPWYGSKEFINRSPR